MSDSASRLADDASALQSAAERLHEDTLDPACTRPHARGGRGPSHEQQARVLSMPDLSELRGGSASSEAA